MINKVEAKIRLPKLVKEVMKLAGVLTIGELNDVLEDAGSDGNRFRWLMNLDDPCGRHHLVGCNSYTEFHDVYGGFGESRINCVKGCPCGSCKVQNQSVEQKPASRVMQHLAGCITVPGKEECYPGCPFLNQK